MLKLKIPGTEFYNEKINEFFTVGDVWLELEHSLLALSKWESKFEKPFLGKESHTNEEILGYIRCMVTTEDFDEMVFTRFTQENVDEVNDYINSAQTATTFSELPKKGKSEIITAELIYFWMIEFNVPFSCESWHINKLFALIKVCNIKKSKPKKMTKAELAERHQKLNAERKARLGTSG